eukprot:CAMPEP_0172484478 /NCGR_PEP_ID=MMETSP1066-20121228/11962_1 /TAXON_ID=671091 /ORGANISM="Coscinodiscus wailesii, Strain CCMP2513" /LENGTH=248 /DNA_ID=CAMNT_0013249045 /DNA_START=77 /DNA_END=823 /DNA_ORIENTATION=-
MASDEATTSTKKRKVTPADETKVLKNGTIDKSKKTKSASLNGDAAAADSAANDEYQHMSLDDIRKKIVSLCEKVPPPRIDDDDEAIKAWAIRMQTVLEEFNILISCVPAATYKWGGERSGAADQNLSLLSGELSASQESISTCVTHRLNNYLAPVVDMVLSKVVITRGDNVDGSGDSSSLSNKEVRKNEYVSAVVDPEFSKLCGNILCRNAKMLRQVVLANFNKVDKVIKDYLKASKKDNQQDRSFSY